MFDNLLPYVLEKTLKSEYFKAQVLAQARHWLTGIGTIAIAKGYADSGMMESVIGLVMISISFWLAHLDVKRVDGKIRVALETPPSDKTL